YGRRLVASQGLQGLDLRSGRPRGTGIVALHPLADPREPPLASAGVAGERLARGAESEVAAGDVDREAPLAHSGEHEGIVARFAARPPHTPALARRALRQRAEDLVHLDAVVEESRGHPTD